MVSVFLFGFLWGFVSAYIYIYIRHPLTIFSVFVYSWSRLIHMFLNYTELVTHGLKNKEREVNKASNVAVKDNSNPRIFAGKESNKGI